MSKKGIEEHLDCGHHAQYLGPAIFWTLLVYHIHHTLGCMSSAKECIGLSMEVEARNDRTVCLVALSMVSHPPQPFQKIRGFVLRNYLLR
jgi:hypothetical protein